MRVCARLCGDHVIELLTVRFRCGTRPGQGDPSPAGTACRGHRPARMNFWSGATFTRTGDALENIKLNAASTWIWTSGPSKTTNPRAPGPRRHPGVFQLDGAAMRMSSWNRCSHRIRASSPSSRCTGPSDGCERAHKLRQTQERSVRHQADSPRTRRTAERDSRRTLVLIVYQEQIMQIAQKVAGYSLRQADTAAPRVQEEERNSRRGVRRFRQKVCGGNSFWAAITALVGCRAAVRRIRVQQIARRRLQVSCRSDRLPPRPTIRPNTWAGLTSVGDDKDKGAIYRFDCRKLGITVLPPDVNESQRNLRRRRRRHPLRRHPQRRHGCSPQSCPPASPKGKPPVSPTTST